MQDSITEIDAPSWAQLRAFLKENEERAELARQKREAEREAREAERQAREAAEAKARAEREAAEAKARAEHEAAEAKLKAEREAAEAKARAEREAERQAREAAEAKARAKREAEREKDFAAWEKKQKAIEKRLGIVEDHWSKLIEALVGNQLVKKLAKRGVKIDYTMQNVKDRTENRFEFDVIGVNGDTVVIVEVKTTLDCEDVSDFLTKKMPNVKSWLTQYAAHKVIGAVAYVHNKNKAAEFAEKKGLFVIMGINDTIEIKNDKDFIPREW